MRIIFLFILLPFFNHSQKDYSTCEHALSVPANGSIKLNLLGKKGSVPSEGIFLHSGSPSKNQAWVTFTCVEKGRLSLSLSHQAAPMHVLLLKAPDQFICQELSKQNLQILVEKTIDSLSSFETEIEVGEKEMFYLVFIGKEKSTQEVFCHFSFKLDASELSKTWPLNLVYNDELPIYRLAIRDEETKKPVEARIVLQGSPEINGIYRASELEMNLLKKVKGGVIHIDAEGFLSKDFENTAIPLYSEFRDTIWLKPVKTGVLAELEDVYFAAGLATILDESYPKLKRLRDFLILNPMVKIEVHGHVNEDSDKDLVSMRLSRKRAQKVVDYLIEGGIDADRLKAIGFGNTRPIYKEPQNEEEKEANRRVEILISH